MLTLTIKICEIRRNEILEQNNIQKMLSFQFQKYPLLIKFPLLIFFGANPKDEKFVGAIYEWYY